MTESDGGVRTERASSAFAATRSGSDAPSEADIRDRYSGTQGDLSVNTTEGNSSETHLAIRTEFDSFIFDPSCITEIRIRKVLNLDYLP